MPQFWPPASKPAPLVGVTTVSESNTPVVFPAGYFTVAPIVVATTVGSKQSATVFNITTSGFTASVESGTIPVNWVAIQP